MFTKSEQYLIDRYKSFTLGTQELKEVAGYKTEKSVLNAISAGTFPIKTYRGGKRRYADVRDVALYLDQMRESAT